MKQRLNAKQRKVRAKEILKKSNEDGSLEMPQNLRRKAVAKRPALGHVVPQKQNGAGGSASPKLRPQGKARAAGLNNPSNLKILGGIARGRRLDSPEVYLRPMMGKVREAVYSTFTSFGLYKEGIATRHLDIFSGSGSVGLESLSRGAAHCTFVDLARDCCETCQRNIDWCQFGDDPEMTRVVNAEAIEALKNPVGVGIPEGFTYNLVTLCPPYEEIVYADLLDAAANSPAVTDDTIILIEYPVELGCLPHVIARNDGGALVGIRNRKYGRTVIALYICNPSGRLDRAESRPEEFVSF
jgi:16S rRNA (guanine966-N2)-methyltransferase